MGNFRPSNVFLTELIGPIHSCMKEYSRCISMMYCSTSAFSKKYTHTKNYNIT